MAFDEAKRMWSRHNGKTSTTDGRRFTATITEVYSTVSDDPENDKYEDVFEAEGLPKLNDLYDQGQFPQIRVKSIAPSQASPILWYVTIEYGGEFGPAGPDDSPLNDPPERNWTDATSNEPIDEDFDGNPIVTANGEPIEGVSMEIADLVLTVKRNFAFFSPADTHEYRHSVNSDEFAGFAPGIARLVGFSADEVIAEEVQPGGGYWEVTARIQFRFPYNTTPEKAWWARVRHEGFYVKSEEDKIIRAVDDQKEPTTRAVLLNEDGTHNEDPENAHWLEFKRYEPKAYNALGLLD